MAIEFRCGQCGRLLRTGDETAGRMAQCPECGTQTPIPFPTSKAEIIPPAIPQAEYEGPEGPDSQSGAAGSPFADSSGAPFDSQTGENPYQSPKQSWQAASQYNPDYVAYAKTRVSGPAIGLIVYGGLGLLLQVASLLFVLFPPAMMMGNNPNVQQMPNFIGPQMNAGFQIVSSAVGLGLTVLVLIGGIKMNKLESYPLAMAAAIIAVIPCFSACCLIGMPIGIWALVVLNDPNVKIAFK